MNGRLALAIAVVATGAAAFVVSLIVSQAGQLQPWSAELSDNFVFARSLPVILGLGVLYGLLGGSIRAPRGSSRRGDGASRRFSGTTIVLHALIALGFLLALPTGVWQYIGGIIDVPGPLPVYLYYRIHYLGAAAILAAVAAFVTYWWMTGDRSLLVPRGEWGRHVRGFALEIPRPLGTRLARLLKLDLGQPAGSPGAFTFYEKVFSFPTWGFGIGLITITGIVKLVRYLLPIPGPVLYVDSTLHVTAMVILVIRTLDHLRYELGHWPFMGAIATGWLPPRRGRAESASPDAVPASTGGAGL